MQHLDEGTIHAWLDGALGPNEASAVERHVQACEQCARAVAEARGLIAASSRILGALDDVPAVPAVHTSTLRGGARRRQRGWWGRSGVGYAAAAMLLLAVGTTVILRNVEPNVAFDATPEVVAGDSRTPQPDVSVLERAVPLSAEEAKRMNDLAAAAPSASGGARSAKEREGPKAELAVDRIVPLPGAMPRPTAPAAPAPGARQEARKALVDVAADAAAPQRRGVVQGRVLDAATGAPVAGATVSVDTARLATRTDSAGKFALQEVPLGNQVVSVRASGFQQAQHQLAVAARDSAQLGFALQKTQAFEPAVTAGQAQTVEQQRRRDAPNAASLNLERIRANAENVLGCYELRPEDAKIGTADERIASMPARVELEGRAQARARRDDAIVNRARTLTGPGRAESWRFVGDSLELVWLDGTSRRALRFARDDGRWVGPGVLLQPCAPRP